MKLNKKTSMLIAACTLILFSLNSCKDDDIIEPPVSDPFENLMEVAKQNTGAGSYVKIYADEALFVGYNSIYIALFDSATNEQITHGEIEMTPMMDMMTMSHSAPHTSPGTTMDEATKAFKGSVVFIMPSGMHGTWSLDLHVHNHANHTDAEISVPVQVVAKSEAKVKSFVRESDSASFFVALLEPRSPEVGLNTITYGVYQRKSMMDFPAVDGLTIEIDPQMLSMGHGSPNNENPTFKAEGMYSGKVNFTMTGKWTIFTALKDEHQKLMGDTLAFELTLP